MIGILVILVVSWLLLHLIQKESLNALGFSPVLKRMHELFLGFLVLGIVQVSFIIDETWITGATWNLNPDLSLGLILETLKYHFISALTEDLVFRGAILYILIERIEANRAMLLSAIVFGVYHWFSYGIINSGELIALIYVFVITGFMGYAWAYTFHKTKSIAMGLGMHLGSNFLQALFYKSNPYGEVLYALSAESPMGSDMNFLFSLAKGLVAPLVCIWFVRLYTKKKETD